MSVMMHDPSMHYSENFKAFKGGKAPRQLGRNRFHGLASPYRLHLLRQDNGEVPSNQSSTFGFIELNTVIRTAFGGVRSTSTP